MRVGGIFLGAMLGMAVGLNGDLLNNAWYITGMIALLTAFFRCAGQGCAASGAPAARRSVVPCVPHSPRVPTRPRPAPVDTVPTPLAQPARGVC